MQNTYTPAITVGLNLNPKMQNIKILLFVSCERRRWKPQKGKEMRGKEVPNDTFFGISERLPCAQFLGIFCRRHCFLQRGGTIVDLRKKINVNQWCELSEKSGLCKEMKKEKENNFWHLGGRESTKNLTKWSELPQGLQPSFIGGWPIDFKIKFEHQHETVKPTWRRSKSSEGQSRRNKKCQKKSPERHVWSLVVLLLLTIDVKYKSMTSKFFFIFFKLFI